MRERFFRNEELLVFRPSQPPLRFANGFTRRIAVGLACTLRRQPVADDGLDGDQIGLVRYGLSVSNSRLDVVEIVAVGNR